MSSLDYIRNEDLVSMEVLERVHTNRHIGKLQRVVDQAENKPIYWDKDTYVTNKTTEAVRNTAHSVLSAVDGATDYGLTTFCLVRPPGHHAGRNYHGGFCPVNFAALAADYAHEKSGGKVLIVDWDAHHGNGTQSIFYTSSDVYYFSMHVKSGKKNDGTSKMTGKGDGVGFTKNVELTQFTDGPRYIERFERSLENIHELIQPSAIVISAGFDAHKNDPFQLFKLSSDDYGKLTHAVKSRFPSTPIVSVLEGGYNLKVLGSSVLSHLEALDE